MKAWFELDFGMAWQHIDCWCDRCLAGWDVFEAPPEFIRMYQHDSICSGSMLGDSYTRAISCAYLGFSP